MDDLISRRDAIDVVHHTIYEFFDVVEDDDESPITYKDTKLLEVNKSISTRIKALPSTQRWIPVTERLPEELEEVNITWVNHAPEQYYDFIKDKHFTGSAVHYKGSWYWYSSTCVDILAEYGRNEMDKIDDEIEVLAWMPLPEPWKGENDESALP